MRLHELVQVTAELAGRPLSDLAVMALTERLAVWPEASVRRALDRCAQELRGSLTLSDVLARLPGAHPAPSEAWAIASKAFDESDSLVWTSAISTAFGEVRHLGDRVAARMAFMAAYQRKVASEPPGPAQWSASLGSDPGRRSAALLEAVDAGRLEAGAASRLLGPVPDDARALPSGASEPVSLAEIQATIAGLLGGRTSNGGNP